MRDFYQFFLKELRDIYSAEQQLLRALPEMAAAAQSPKLKEAFTHHLEETKNQVNRLQEISQELKEQLTGELCKAMQGLIAEAQEMIKAPFEGTTRDAALISAAQRIEHYEMAAYGCAKTYAKLLKLSKVEDLLKESLHEKANADKKLTSIAEGSMFTTGINKEACRKSCDCK